MAGAFVFSPIIKKTFGIKSEKQIEVRVNSTKTISKNRIMVSEELEDTTEIQKHKREVFAAVNQVLNTQTKEVVKEKTKEYINAVNIKSKDILEQIPAEKPNWIFKTPYDKNKKVVYFVGRSYGADQYEKAFESARKESMVELCQFIKLTVDKQVTQIKIDKPKDFERKMILKIASISKNTFMQESRVIGRYYAKLKPNNKINKVHYQLFLLIAYPKTNVDKATKQSLEYERELLKANATKEQLAKLDKIIKHFKGYNLTQIKQQLDHERSLLTSHKKIENLYQKCQWAEEREKIGKILSAYRSFHTIRRKLRHIAK